MPKIVDHAVRRRSIVEAFWVVVMREGIDAATVRAVAAQANCPPASLRYYVSTQQELLELAWDDVAARIMARAKALVLPNEPLAAWALILEQTLPLDEERRTECQIWFVMLEVARTNMGLRDRVDEVQRTLRQTCHHAVTSLMDQGLVSQKRSVELESMRLHALIDGMSMHRVSHPGEYSPADLRAILLGHLRELVGAPIEDMTVSATP